MNVFDQMLSQYKVQSTDELLNATHQVMQQITLAALYRAGFFSQAAFYGGTCLRIFYGLPRFSEDMDFSLLHPERTFKLENYFSAITEEFETLGRKVIITKKEKKNTSQVASAFLKDTTAVYDLKFTTNRSIKIKIEVDTNPPPGFMTENKLLLLPFSFMTRCYSLTDLYAGKMHAFLFRNWKNRVKGRDWYDFEWFVRHNTAFNLEHFNQRAMQTGLAGQEQLDTRQFKAMLIEKIKQTNIDHVLADVRPFVQHSDALAIWSTDYFIQLVELMRFE